MLSTRSVRPSQIGPIALSRAASAQSSIRASRMAAMPPARRNASARTSTHPPAAAAVPAGRLTQENGYSIWKKNTKAGMRQRSATLIAAQLDHERGEDRLAGGRLGHEPAEHPVRVNDIGIRQQQIGRGRDRATPRPRCPG